MNDINKNQIFIEKARKVHGDKYDYSKVEYIKAHSNVCIICPIHGEFYQNPNNHLSGKGCIKCYVEKNTSNTETFIEKAILVHGDKYDYSKVEYVNAITKVCIICPIHGEFQQTPHCHLNGRGCNKCGIDKATSDTSAFIERGKIIHGERYDYSKVEYINNSTKVSIICPIHGEFEQIPSIHLSGSRCPKCYVEKNTSDTPSFILKAKEIHGDKYDYSKVEYIHSKKKVCIICPIHGEFNQKACHHLSSAGCKKCANEKMLSNNEEFINKARKIHGNNYNYSKVEYVNNNTKICIICPIHGEFEQKPNAHLKGRGCNKCVLENQTSNTLSFIEKANEVHGDKYDYSNVEYINNKTLISINCSIHGKFYQMPYNHLRGGGCNECGKKTISEKNTSDTSTFIEKSKVIHGDKYDYSKVEYINAQTNVCIICLVHGEFYQQPTVHLKGGGCPKCSHSISNAETEIGDYIESLGLEMIRSNRKILSGLEIDLYIPSKNIAIEYNGLYWHSEGFGKDKNYHLNKTLECNKQGIDLIHIFEDEYLTNKTLVLNKLKHMLKVHEECIKIMGRKCNIDVINNETAMSFLNTYHIQGYDNSTVHLGAVYGNELIAVMSFKKENKKSLKWELTRFASNSAYVCQGIGGKLFNHFIKTYNPSEVKSFADRRWTLNEENNLYTKLGFELGSILAPDYNYVDNNNKRFNKKLNSSLDTSSVSKLHKIWDCGLFKYVWKNNDINII